MYNLYKLKWLIDMLNANGRNYDILQLSRGVYCICDMSDNQRMLKSGNLAFLIWFCEWLLYVE